MENFEHGDKSGKFLGNHFKLNTEKTIYSRKDCTGNITYNNTQQISLGLWTWAWREEFTIPITPRWDAGVCWFRGLWLDVLVSSLTHSLGGLGTPSVAWTSSVALRTAQAKVPSGSWAPGALISTHTGVGSSSGVGCLSPLVLWDSHPLAVQTPSRAFLILLLE